MAKLRVVQLDAGGDNADWIKAGWGWPEIKNVHEMRLLLERMGRTVGEFRMSPAFRLPIKYGTAPDWLRDL